MAQQQITTMFETITKLQLQNQHLKSQNIPPKPTPVLTNPTTLTTPQPGQPSAMEENFTWKG